MSNTLTTLDAIIKELYPDQKVIHQVYKDHPFLQLLAKNEKFTGDNMVVPVGYGNTNRRSATFSTASSASSGESAAKFNVTRVQDYALADIDREAILASKGREGAFVDAVKYVMDGALFKIKNSLASSVFRKSTGSVGAVGSISTTVLTLADPEDVVNFEVNDEIKLSATDGGAARSGSATVTAVDRDAGTLTTDSNWATQITGATAGDFLTHDGDLNAKMSGLEDWLDSSAGALFGVTRTVDPVRLAGVHVTGTSLPIAEALNKACARVAREGGTTDCIVLNHGQWEALSNSLQSQMHFYTGKKGGEVGFPFFIVNTPAGPAKVVADRFCPADVAYALDMSTWKLASLGKAPHIFDDDGVMIRNSGSDSYEVRVGYYGQLVCQHPGANARVTLAGV